jgi:hypothetical protein
MPKGVSGAGDGGTTMSQSKEWAFYTRDPRRYSTAEIPGATIELADPRDGIRRVLALINISEGGLCFRAGSDFPAIMRNKELHGVVVRLGGRALRGDFVASYVCREGEGAIVCGGQFRAATELDEVGLRNMIASLGEVREPA